jgi:ABC-type Fe3+ transport system permease subunit
MGHDAEQGRSHPAIELLIVHQGHGLAASQGTEQFAGPVTTLLRITAPLIAANLIAGAILAFAFSMLEVSDSLILAQEQRFFPITKAIYSLFGSLGNGPFTAAALGVWAMIFLSVALVGAVPSAVPTGHSEVDEGGERDAGAVAEKVSEI